MDPTQTPANTPAAGVSPAAAEIGGRPDEKAKWATKTSATLLTAVEFAELKDSLKLHVVGVTGFSGQWSEKKIAEDEGVRGDATSARVAVNELLRSLKSQHGSRLVLSSGATMEGVPKIIYEECEKLGIDAMGVTSAKAYDYPLGKMKYLVVEGADWGAESPTFIASSSEIVMIGGGGQAKREAIAANASGKSVTVFKGYKGTADQLTPGDVPGATFIERK